MKVGYTPMEAYNLFRSLRREVFNFFGYDQPLSFGVRDSRKHPIFNVGSLAHCDFGPNPDAPSIFDEAGEYANGIRVDGRYLPYLYEDELICILLHELSHAVLPFEAYHGPVWQNAARQVGAVPDSHFLMRNWQAAFADDLDVRLWAMSQPGPTMDVFAGSL